MADLVVDHEWCKTCEKKFADLESFYAQTLASYKDTPYQSTKLSLAALVFWLSIVWRGSVTETTNFRLSDKDERKLRNLINDYQPGQPEDLFLKKHEAILSEISYKLFRCADYAKQVAPESGSFFFPSKQRQPYSFIIDEFVVLIYMRKVYLKGIQPTFFGFEKIQAPLNNYKEGEMIYSLSVTEFSGFMDKLVGFFKEIKLHWYESKLNKLYHKIGHQGNMPEHIKNEILAQVSKDETKLGRKYTYEDFAKCSQEVLLKHHHELRRIDRKRR